ncbi:hypothetical protein OV450_5651 [Actinobacteria bacterium OV450]|nr:hypothetical protein OV450_5651 [Actinobacteria bacterium OV450]
MLTHRTGARPAQRRTALLAPCAALLLAVGVPPAAAATADPAPAPAPAATMTPPAPTRIPSPLKPIRPAALRAVDDRAAKRPAVPGAAVLHRTPQGAFRPVTGTSEPGTAPPPSTG